MSNAQTNRVCCVKDNGVEIGEDKKEEASQRAIPHEYKIMFTPPAEGLEPSTTGLKGQRSTKLS